MTFGQGKDAARFQTAGRRSPWFRATWVWPALAMLLAAVGYDSFKEVRPTALIPSSDMLSKLPRPSDLETGRMATDDCPIACDGINAGQPICLASTLSLDSIQGPANPHATDPGIYRSDRGDNLLWEFPQPPGKPLLVRLPLVSMPSDRLPDMTRLTIDPNKHQRLMVTLLPPQSIESAEPSTDPGTFAVDAETDGREMTECPSGEVAPHGRSPESSGDGPTIREVPGAHRPEQSVPEQTGRAPEETERMEPVQLSDVAAALATGARTGAKVNELAMAKINRGRLLAERGAYFAARQEFLQVVRMLARARDARLDDPIHLRALAEGLRAMDEAEDFLPRGTTLEANIDIGMIASSHRTTLLRKSPESKVEGPESEESGVRSPESGVEGPEIEQLMPQQCISRYFHYAQLRLSEAVASEPSGSMALHALGKVIHRQAVAEPDCHPLAHRRAFTYQQAALLAHGQNHLAAHELGILLADSGHYAEAQRLLLEVSFRQPHPTVFQNLAKVQRKMGNLELAEANMRLAEQQVHPSDKQDRLVQWISPSEFATTGNGATHGMPQPSATHSAHSSRTPDSRDSKTPSLWRWPWSKGQSSDLAPLHAAKGTETGSMPASSAVSNPRTYR